MKITVARPFCLAGERQETGTVLEVEDRFARELIHNGKAAVASEPPAAPASEPPAAVARGRKEAKA